MSGRIAGYAAACAEGRNAEIASLAVHPDYRRRGVALALMRHTLQSLQAAGARRVELMVRIENTGGAQLYRSLRFPASWHGSRLLRGRRRCFPDGQGDTITGMADKDHFELLMRDVNAWNQWRQEHPKEKPDLAFAVMRGADLMLANLSGAVLSEADLVLANLRGADLGMPICAGRIWWAPG